MLHIKRMCLSSKLLKIGNYYKERRNLIQFFGIPIGVMVHSVTQDYFTKQDTKRIPSIATVSSVNSCM